MEFAKTEMQTSLITTGWATENKTRSYINCPSLLNCISRLEWTSQMVVGGRAYNKNPQKGLGKNI